MERMVSLMDILAVREKRAMRQRELIDIYQKPLVCFTMNIAGPLKNSPEIKRGFTIGKQMFDIELHSAGIKCLHFEEISDFTGNEAFYVLDSDPMVIKKITTEMEEKMPLGRLFDLDVLDIHKRKLDREEIGVEGRKCLICGKEAKACARNRTHSVEELQKKTGEILKQAIDEVDAEKVSELVCRALLYEVATTPKPGLVDCKNNGSHKDMDIFTFINSACALRPYFKNCVRIGRMTSELTASETFKQIRNEGKKAEYQMFEATNGVNTHKGAVFSMGILCGALGRLTRDEWERPDTILDECARIAKGVVDQDLKNISRENAVTTGQKLYLDYGITGVRGQAEEGFPAVKHVGLPIFLNGLKQGYTWNESGCAALLAIMAESVDTNLIARSDVETQKRVAAKIRHFLDKYPYPNKMQLENLDKQFVKANLSPGGSADLLAVCYLLFFLKEEAERETLCLSI